MLPAPNQRVPLCNQCARAEQAGRAGQHYGVNSAAQAGYVYRCLADGLHDAVGGLHAHIRVAHFACHGIRRAHVAAGPSVHHPVLDQGVALAPRVVLAVRS